MLVYGTVVTLFSLKNIYGIDRRAHYGAAPKEKLGEKWKLHGI